MKSIYGLLANVPANLHSHNAAWARMWSNLIGADVVYELPKSGEIYYYLEINFTGSLNLFGGLDKKTFDRLESFLNYSGKQYILEHDMPDLGEMLKSRIGNTSTYSGLTEDFCKELSKKCKTIQSVKMDQYFKNDVIIGDSHSISMAKKGEPVIRLDAKTLFGALRGEDGMFIDNKIPSSVKNVTLMFGSIDIRHHLFRQEDPYLAATKLLDMYFAKVKDLHRKGYTVSICTPVPVETESRKMAKTTMYKGACFYGSREDRLKLTKFVVQYMKDKAPCAVIQYPEFWYDMDPVAFEDTIMERPRSIHIGFPYYRMNNFGKKGISLDDF